MALPLPPLDAAIELVAPADRQQITTAAKAVYVVARPERPAPWRAASLTGGDNSPLSLRPTELADGLALKELRYERGVRFSRLPRLIRPTRRRYALPPIWFPRSPVERQTQPPGDSAGLFEGREFSCGRGRVNKCGFVTRFAALLATISYAESVQIPARLRRRASGWSRPVAMIRRLAVAA